MQRRKGYKVMNRSGLGTVIYGGSWGVRRVWVIRSLEKRTLRPKGVGCSFPCEMAAYLAKQNQLLQRAEKGALGVLFS